MDIVFTVYSSHASTRYMSAVKVQVYITYTHLQFICFLSHSHTHTFVYLYSQEVDTASARWWGDPDKAEAGGGLVANM